MTTTACPLCKGKGCSECNDTGEYRIYYRELEKLDRYEDGSYGEDREDEEEEE